MNQYLNFNGSCLSACVYPLKTRVEADRNYCDLPCQSLEYLYQNGSCLSSCLSLTQIVEGVLTCKTVCPNTTPFLYWDDSCSDSCEPPLISITQPQSYSKCNYSCSIDQYLYWNGTCTVSCNSPLITKIVKARNLCTYPCAEGQYLTMDGSCLTSYAYPKKTRVEVDANYCDLPCSNSEYFYENGTCLLSCSPPMKIATVNNVKVCQKPCVDPTPYYSPDDQNCLSVCSSPSKAFDRAFYTSCELQISSEDRVLVRRRDSRISFFRPSLLSIKFILALLSTFRTDLCP